MAGIVNVYVGAFPAGRPAPDLSTVPVTSGVNFILAFARDVNRDGVFQPVWDPAITPDVTNALQQSPNYTYCWASLGGGDNFPWQTPSDPQQWVNNAIDSLMSMKATYGLVGFDVDYENGLDENFPGIMADVINGYQARIGPNGPIVLWSYSPFGGTVQSYLALDQQTPVSAIIRYQAYADVSDPQACLDLYARVVQEFNPTFFTLGIASSTASPRGVQPPAIYDVARTLQQEYPQTFTFSGPTFAGATIWCLEDSVLTDPPYVIESTLQGLI